MQPSPMQPNHMQSNHMQPNSVQSPRSADRQQAYVEDVQPCWKKIGVWGDRTCEVLNPGIDTGEQANIVHCRDCSTFVAAGLQLLQRPVPAAYLAERTQQLAAIAPRSDAVSLVSMLIFRLGEEWLALPAKVCQQIMPVVGAHTLPHRTNATLLGVVNVRGQLLLKVSLGSVLSIVERVPAVGHLKPGHPEARAYSRMVVIGNTPDVWVFEADELLGVYAVEREQMVPVDKTDVERSMACVQAVFDWQGKQVSAIEESRLFEALRQQAL